MILDLSGRALLIPASKPLLALGGTVGRRSRERLTQAVAQALVIPFVMVVRDELLDGAAQGAFADKHHPFGAGFLDRSHKAFRIGVQVGRARGEPNGRDPSRGERVPYRGPERQFAVMDEDPHVPEEPVVAVGRVPHELGHPEPVRFDGDIGDLHTAGRELDQDQHGEACETAEMSRAGDTVVVVVNVYRERPVSERVGLDPVDPDVLMVLTGLGAVVVTTTSLYHMACLSSDDPTTAHTLLNGLHGAQPGDRTVANGRA